MTGVVSLKPTLNFPDEAFLKLVPQVVLENSSNTSYNTKTTAVKIPDQFCFHFGFYCDGLNRNYNTYEIKVVVSLDFNLKQNLKPKLYKYF